MKSKSVNQIQFFQEAKNKDSWLGGLPWKEIWEEKQKKKLERGFTPTAAGKDGKLGESLPFPSCPQTYVVR